MSEVTESLKKVLANTYLLYLKTQNYHWNVEGGPYFKSLHELFETNYQELALGLDSIAERIRQLGTKAPATFNEFQKLALIKDGNASKKANDMLSDLAADQQIIIDLLRECIGVAAEAGDDVSADLLIERLAAHEKAAWFYSSSVG